MNLGVVILGAGASSRMGQPKLLLPWRGTTVLGHTLAQWKSVGPRQIAVVCGPSPHPVFAELERLPMDGVERIVNPTPERGMFSSIQCAARWSGWDRSINQFAISLGDQPQIQENTLRTLIAQSSAQPDRVWQPAFKGRPRHPVI